jgi:ATP-dependent Clp protease ATP-binding subunit ClpX
MSNPARPLTTEEIVARLDEVAVGQLEAKQTLALALLRHERRAAMAAAGIPEDDLVPRQNVLLIGPTGSGKTLLVESLAKLTGLPFCKVDPMRFMAGGAPAERPEQLLVDLVRAAGPEGVVERGIVFLDEIDKVRRHGPGRDPGEAVQHALLHLLDGTERTLTVGGRLRTLHTGKILFVAAGAFEGLEEIVRDRLERGGFGFGARPRGEGQRYLTLADLEEYGLVKEFALRFPVRATLRALERADYRDILAKSKRSPVKLRIREFEWGRVRLEFQPEALDAIVEATLRDGTGPRGLEATVERALRSVTLELPQLPARGIGRVVIPAGVLDGAEPLLEECAPLPPPSVVLPQAPATGASGEEFYPRKLLPVRAPRAVGAQGTGRWASEADLASWLSAPRGGHVTRLRGVTVLVEAHEDGSAVQALPGRDLYFPDEERRKHLLCVGKAGSGKTTRFILPLLAADLEDPERSVVVVDAQLDLTPRVLALTRQLRGAAARVVYINFTDPARSHGWNPLAGVVGATQAYRLANALAQAVPASTADTGFFRLQAIQVLGHLIHAQTSLHPEYANLGTIRQLVTAGGPALKRLGEAAGLEQLVKFARTLPDNQNAVTALMELENILTAWADEEVCATTAHSEFAFDELDAAPTVLILAMPEERVLALRPLTACFVGGLLDFVMRRGRGGVGLVERPISLVIDEFASAVGKLKDLEVRVNTLRKRGLCLVAAVQSLEQVLTTYGKEGGKNLLAGLGTLCVIPPIDHADAEQVAHRAGYTTVQEVMLAGDGVTPTGVRPHRRQILDPDDLQGLPAHPTLGPRMSLLLPGTAPFQLHLPPMYEQAEFRAAFQSAEQPAERPEPLAWPLLGGEEAEPAAGGPFTDTRGWSDEKLRQKLVEVRTRLGWANAPADAQSWWDLYEREHQHALRELLRFAEELASHRATIAEIARTFDASETDDRQANVHYLLYLRRKEAEARRRRAGAS